MPFCAIQRHSAACCGAILCHLFSSHKMFLGADFKPRPPLSCVQSTLVSLRHHFVTFALITRDVLGFRLQTSSSPELRPIYPRVIAAPFCDICFHHTRRSWALTSNLVLPRAASNLPSCPLLSPLSGSWALTSSLVRPCHPCGESFPGLSWRHLLDIVS